MRVELLNQLRQEVGAMVAVCEELLRRDDGGQVREDADPEKAEVAVALVNELIGNPEVRRVRNRVWLASPDHLLDAAARMRALMVAREKDWRSVAGGRSPIAAGSRQEFRELDAEIEARRRKRGWI